MNKPGAAVVLLLLGSVGLIVVVLTHVAEALHIFPSMGWGLPDSAGHYLDLVSAILGCVLLSLGFLIALLGSKVRREKPADRARGCESMSECELEDRAENGQRQLPPTADIRPQRLMTG